MNLLASALQLFGGFCFGWHLAGSWAPWLYYKLTKRARPKTEADFLREEVAIWKADRDFWQGRATFWRERMWEAKGMSWMNTLDVDMAMDDEEKKGGKN